MFTIKSKKCKYKNVFIQAFEQAFVMLMHMAFNHKTMGIRLPNKGTVDTQ